MNSRSGSPGAPCARTHSSNSPHSGRWTLSYSARKLSQSLGSSAGYPEDAGGPQRGKVHHVVLDDHVRAHPIDDPHELLLAVPGAAGQLLPDGLDPGLELLDGRLAELGRGVADEVLPELPGSTAPSAAGAARSTRSSVNPSGASLPRHDASAAKTARWPRRRSRSPMPMQLLVGP